MTETSQIPQNASRKFFLTNLSVGIGTLLSRVTGFGRIFALTYAIGLSGLSDAYNTANTTPNIIYELMLGGILSATLLPTFVKSNKDNDKDAINAVINVILVLLGGLTILTVLAAPWIMQLYALTRVDQTTEFTAVGTDLIRFFMPQIFFYGMISVATSLLNAEHKFSLTSYAPILNNLTVIGMLLMLPHLFGTAPSLDIAIANPSLVAYLGIGTTAGIAISALVLIPAMIKSGVRLSLRPDWQNPAVRNVLRLSGWTVGYVMANQIALFLVSLIALHREGWMTAYQTAFAFFILPHGLLAMTITTTFMPKIAHDAAAGDMDGFKAKISEGLKWLVFLILPASAGYMLVARPLLVTLLNHGQFSMDAALLTGDTLAMFAVGLLPFSLYLFLLRGFYALSDTKTPFKINVVENILNVVLAYPLAMIFGVKGLALAYAIAYIGAAFLTAAALNKRVAGGLFPPALSQTLMKIAVSVLVMATSVFVVLSLTSAMSELIQLSAAVICGALVYAGLALAFRLVDLRALKR